MSTANQSNKELRQTLEQQRAQDAWNRSANCSEEYMKLAKGLPAMIMNSGLMQVIAFLHEKGQKDSQRHCAVLGDHLRDWLRRRFPNLFAESDFGRFMEALMSEKTTSQAFQAITSEAFAWLRWVRQMAAATHTKNGGN